MADGKRSLLFFGAGSSVAFGIPSMVGMVTEFEKRFQFPEYDNLIWEFSRKAFETPKWKIEIPGLTEPTNEAQASMEDIENLSPLPQFKKLFHLWSTMKRDIGDEYVDIEQMLTALIEIKPAEIIPENLRYEHDVDPIYYGEFVGKHDLRSTPAERIKVFDTAVRALSESLIREIMTFIKLRCTPLFDVNRLQSVLSPLFTLLASRETLFDIVTTNYDRAIETLLEFQKVVFQDGVTPDGIFRPTELDGASNVPRLLKLHGSVDLYETETCIRKIPSPNVEYLSDGTRVGQAMIYPLPAKDFGDDLFGQLYANLEKWLHHAQGCVAIGYSFRDDRVRETFTSLLDTNRCFSMAIVAPNAGDIVSQYFRAYPDRVFAVACKLEEATTEELERACSVMW